MEQMHPAIFEINQSPTNSSPRIRIAEDSRLQSQELEIVWECIHLKMKKQALFLNFCEESNVAHFTKPRVAPARRQPYRFQCQENPRHRAFLGEAGDRSRGIKDKISLNR